MDIDVISVACISYYFRPIEAEGLDNHLKGY